MITKENIRTVRLEVLEAALNEMDFNDNPIKQGVLEGLAFNIGKLVLEHLKDTMVSNKQE